MSQDEPSGPDLVGVEHLRVNSCRGIIDIIRGGSPPLDFDTVSD